MGMLYKRGNIRWVKYYRNGKSIRESSKSKSKMVAVRLLKRREGEIAQGKIPSVQFEKVTFDQLAEGLRQDYRINQKKTLNRIELSIGHLSGHFGGFKATQISTPMINSYVVMRLDAGAAHATINRELAALKRMLNIGAKQTPPLVDRVPHIPMLKENNTRKGFFEHEEFLALRDALPDYLKGFVTFAYKSGWRRSEISSITWKQVDRRQGIVRLEVGETKNDDARTLYLDGELKDIFNQQWENRKTNHKILPYVFLNKSGTDKIKDIRKAWKKACNKAGFGVKIFHDFRRTAVRNMVRSGIPERVAMMISGHKTRNVFDRYNIVNDQDLKRAAMQQAEYLRAQHGHNLGTICHFEAQNKGQEVV
jgi:integrase